MLPKNISKRYELYKHEGLGGQSSSEKGLYLDKETGQLVFIKVYSDKKSQLREYQNQQFFYKQSKELNTTEISIPKPLGILNKDNYSAFIMEYIQGKPILKADIKTRINAYIKVLKFLEKINNRPKINQKPNFKKRSSIQQLTTLPYFFLMSLILNSPHAKLILSKTIFVARFSKNWKDLSSNWICHGDINVTNILLLGKKVIILDFASVNMSHRYFDLSRALNSTWYQEGFHKEFWNHIIKEFNFNKNQQKILKSFVVFNLIQRLSQRLKNSQQRDFYLKQLEFSGNYK